MKIQKTANGKAKIIITRSEWINYGRQAGWMETLEGVLEEGEMQQLNQYADRLFSTGDPSADMQAKQQAMKDVFIAMPYSLQEAMDALQKSFQEYMKRSNRPHVNKFDSGPPNVNMYDMGEGQGLNASKKGKIVQKSQVDQLQPLDGVQNSDAAEGFNGKKPKLTCSNQKCKATFPYDPTNPDETKCPKCRD
jgi:hypothetical protein